MSAPVPGPCCDEKKACLLHCESLYGWCLNDGAQGDTDMMKEWMMNFQTLPMLPEWKGANGATNNDLDVVGEIHELAKMDAREWYNDENGGIDG